jgi:hypothetical protein
MTQAFVAASTQARLQPDSRENDLLDPLCRLAGDMRNIRMLIVADNGLDLMCGLIRRGCPAATVLRFGDKPDADDYNVVVVPHVTSADDVIRLARRSLAPNGRLIAGVSDGTAAAALARRLRLNGFRALRSTHLSGMMLLSADLRRAL